MGYNNKQNREPDTGIGYRATYKKDGREVGYLKLYVRPDMITELPRNERGFVELVAFSVVGDKKSEMTPDLVIKPSVKKEKSGNAQQTNQTTGPDFPF